MLGEEHSEISSNTHWLWASEVNELHTQLEQDIHPHSSDYVPPLSQKNVWFQEDHELLLSMILIHHFHLEYRSIGTFVRGCLLWALRELYALGQMILHLCGIPFPSTQAAVKCLHTSDSALREPFLFSIWLGQGVTWMGKSMCSISLLAGYGSQSEAAVYRCLWLGIIHRQPVFHLSLRDLDFV